MGAEIMKSSVFHMAVFHAFQSRIQTSDTSKCAVSISYRFQVLALGNSKICKIFNQTDALMRWMSF